MFLEEKKIGEQVHPIHGFIAWLETKDPNETYNWANVEGQCLIGLYMTSIGKSYKIEYSLYMKLALPYKGCVPSVALGNGPGDWTFGKALTRAKAALPHIK